MYFRTCCWPTSSLNLFGSQSQGFIADKVRQVSILFWNFWLCFQAIQYILCTGTHIYHTHFCIEGGWYLEVLQKWQIVVVPRVSTLPDSLSWMGQFQAHLRREEPIPPVSMHWLSRTHFYLVVLLYHSTVFSAAQDHKTFIGCAYRWKKWSWKLKWTALSVSGIEHMLSDRTSALDYITIQSRIHTHTIVFVADSKGFLLNKWQTHTLYSIFKAVCCTKSNLKQTFSKSKKTKTKMLVGGNLHFKHAKGK